MQQVNVRGKAETGAGGNAKAGWAGLLLGVCMIALPAACPAASPEAERVNAAVSVLRELFRVPEVGIPEEMLTRCHALAVFPSVYKGGVVVGASYGKGLIVVRDWQTGQWRGPAFLSIGSGSLGWQLGFQATDLVLVVMNRRGVESFVQNNVTLGGALSVAAGPVGREVKAATDVQLRAEVYSYSRSKGFFAGLSLEGAGVAQDYEANQAFYGRPWTPGEILLTGHVAPPAAAEALHSLLARRASSRATRGAPSRLPVK